MTTAGRRRRVLLTGASGYVGQRLAGRLLEDGWQVLAAVRRPGQAPAGTEELVVGDLAGPVAWREPLAGVAAVVHGAGAVHGAAGHLFAVNRDATEHLGHAAAEAGVERFVLVSSLAAQAVEEASVPGAGESARLIAGTAYARSKHAGEAVLRREAGDGPLRPVVIRPAAVYGPGAPGKLGLLARAVRLGVPLPFAAIDARRSLVFVDNLVDALALAIEHPAAPGGTFAVSDGEALPLPELVRRMAAATGRAPRLFRCPAGVFRGAGRLLRQERLVDSLIGSFVADDAAIRERLGWRPPVGIDDALARTLA